MENPTKLVVIDTKTLRHSAYEGRERVATSKFTRTLDVGEVETFRINPEVFLNVIEEIDENIAA